MNHSEETKIVNDSLFTLVVYNYTKQKKILCFIGGGGQMFFVFCFVFFQNRFSGLTLKQNQKRRMCVRETEVCFKL